MSSLNVDLNYFDHSKTMRLEARLGPGADVLPIRLWAYIGRLHPDSGRVAMLEAELERVCRWWGEKGAMIAAMTETGFIEHDGDFFIIHDWFEHSGHLAMFRKRAKKAARIRWGKHRKLSNATSNARPMLGQSPYITLHSSSVHIKKESVRVPKHFMKPSPEEVTSYAQSIGFKLDGNQFCDYYESKGWKVGSSPMKSWQAAIRTWKKRHMEDNPNASNGSASVSESVVERTRKREAEEIRKREASAKPIPSGI